MDKMTLQTSNVSIEFPGVKALQNVNYQVSTGKIYALVGANGAGKSTLMKVLSGANPHYTGDIYFKNKKVEIRTPVQAKKYGIQIVYQEVDTALYANLSVAENIVQNEMVMGETGFFINWNAIYKEGRKALDRIHIDKDEIDEKELVQNLTLAQKQMVLIAKAMNAKCNFLILDEPTAPLSITETEKLFDIVRHLHKTENIAIIFISHRLNEVLQICQEYTVMRNGEIVDTKPVNENTTTKEIVDKMLGKSFTELFVKEQHVIGKKIFQVDSLSDTQGKVNDVSFYIRQGEIVGIAGLVGAGKSELCKTIFGAYDKQQGKMTLNDKVITINKPADAVKQRIALVPEERRKEGVLVDENVSFNLSAACLDKFCHLSFMNKIAIDKNAKQYVDKLGISTPSVHQLVKNLSGGNQQKVAVGKWLETDCDIYIFDEPTKGVDVGAKRDIFKLIIEIAKRGKGVLYVSCENSELLSLTDRIYVMYSGKIQAELKTEDTTEDEIMNYSVGGEKSEWLSGERK